MRDLNDRYDRERFGDAFATIMDSEKRASRRAINLRGLSP